MKTGFALLALLGLSILFEIDKLWINSSDIKSDEYSYVQLTAEDSVKAIDKYKKNIHLTNIRFYIKPFPFSEQTVSGKTHIYFIFEHLYIIGIMILWLVDKEKNTKPYIRMFMILLIGDFIDYLLTFNDEYSRTGLSYNILFIIIYAVYIGYKGIFDEYDVKLI